MLTEYDDRVVEYHKLVNGGYFVKLKQKQRNPKKILGQTYVAIVGRSRVATFYFGSKIQVQDIKKLIRLNFISASFYRITSIQKIGWQLFLI